MRLGQMVWPEVPVDVTLLVPLGSTEQHGPHLPLDTDTRIAEAVAWGAAAEVPAAVVAPAVAIGASGEHAGFAGTLSIGTEALRIVLVELVRSADWASRIVFVNGHGGNHDAVTATVRQLTDEGHDVAAWWPRVAGGDAHAGRTETSLLLAIAPDKVRLDSAEAGNTAPIADLIDDLRRGGVAAASANGVLGDPAGASAEAGEALLADLVADLVSLLRTP